MLSRLSGLANVVLHELSGDDTAENMRTSLEPVSNSVLNYTVETYILCFSEDKNLRQKGMSRLPCPK